jgi:hypothetical protein
MDGSVGPQKRSLDCDKEVGKASHITSRKHLTEDTGPTPFTFNSAAVFTLMMV